MAIRKVGNVWFFYWKQKGKIITRTTHCTDKRKAEVVARDMAAAVKAEKIRQSLSQTAGGMPAFMVPKVAPVNKTRLDTMFATACKYRKLSHLHELLWTRFVKGCGKTYAEDVTPKVALNFLESLNCKSNKTYNNNKTILNMVFKLCFADTGVESPLKNILNRVVDNVKSHRNITEAEFKLILDNASPFWRFLATVSYYTGMPKESCMRFCPEWIVDIDGVKWAKYLRAKTSRFGRYCQVPLCKEVIDALPDTESTKTPYCQSFGIPSTKLKINTEFGELLRSLNILDNEDGTADFHSLRSSFITACRSKGIPDHAIRSMVGHTDSATTDIYSHDVTTPLMILQQQN